MFSWKAVNVAASTQHSVRYVPVLCLMDHKLQGRSASTNQYASALAAFSSMLPTRARSAYGTLDTVSLLWRDETGARYLHSTVYGSPGCFGCQGYRGSRKTRPFATDVNEVNTGIVVYTPTLNQCIEGSISRELGQNFGKRHGFNVSDPSSSVESDATPV